MMIAISIRKSLIIVTLFGGLLAASALRAQADTVDVSIVNFSFDPPSINIEPGTTVRWTNDDGIAHTSTSESGVWDSGILLNGQSFAFTFNTVGDFPYICTLHPIMEGTVVVNAPTDVGDESDLGLPENFWLGANYPNPFNPITAFDYSLPTRAYVVIEIFNIAGSRVAMLVNEELSAGVHTTSWDGTNENGQPMGSGVYFYRLQADDYSQTRRMVLLK